MAALTRISGVGKKTAERIVLELRDKIGQIGSAATLEPGLEAVPAGTAFEEALAALQALGYQPGEILPRLRKVSSGDATAQELIRLVLREMVGR